MLNDDERHAFLGVIYRLDKSTREWREIKHRSKLIVGMSCCLRFRIFELEKSYWSSVYFEGNTWCFFVKGRGGKLSKSNKKLKKMSSHWLRQLSAPHQDKLGVPATIIKDNHRHGSFLTTQIYLHREDDIPHQEIQKSFCFKCQG